MWRYNSLSRIWTHGHWIPFRHATGLSYQAMSSTQRLLQFCSVSTFHFGHCLYQLPHMLYMKSCTGSHASSEMNWYIWYSPLNGFHSSYRKLTWVGYLSSLMYIGIYVYTYTDHTDWSYTHTQTQTQTHAQAHAHPHAHAHTQTRTCAHTHTHT